MIKTLESNFESEYKRILLDTFRFLISFLNQHNLRWWVAYGTAIGAIRHHGLIPWDDDIDIWMPREDYETLILLKQEMMKCSGGRYGIGHIKADVDYAARFAKVMDMTTTVQAKRFIPSVMGVWVDIFPLDSTSESISIIEQKYKEVNTLWSRYFDYFKHYSIADIKDYKYSKTIIINAIKSNFRINEYKKDRLMQSAIECDEHASTCSFADGVYCYCLYGYDIKRSIFKVDLFNGYNEIPYEDYMVRIPRGYDEVLTQLYGDYMTPPPVEKRMPRHFPYYANLKERLSLQEIAQRVKAGETIVY